MRVVTAGILVRGDHFLIAQRCDDDECGGLWEFPGGSVEPDETPDRCVIRELREELGVAARPVALYDVIETDWGGILLFYLCETRDEPRPLDCQAVRWVTPDELARTDTHISDRPVFRRLADDAPHVFAFMERKGGIRWADSSM
ncbi:MAG: (deoxy)nucleoside triphosphate pyrophosphohydrolase [Clostridiales bacterium]|nr:(deoxy)nucleoside triphosphate pyrophosphohydrolase [Clostridiales bacterium]